MSDQIKRDVVFLTLTDAKRRSGDYVRMSNIVPKVSLLRSTKALSLPGYREESWKVFGKYVYGACKEAARLILTVGVLLSSRRPVYYTWDWILARDLALLSYVKRFDYVLEVNGFHSYESELNGYFPRGGFIHRMYVVPTERLAARRAARIVAVSEPMRRLLSDRYGVAPEKISVATNASDPVTFAYQGPAPMDDRPFTVGWIGSFQPYHGLQTLVDTARLLRDEGHRLRFLLVGDGPQRPKIEEEIRARKLNEYFVFAGRVAWEGIPAALIEAHCCISVPGLTPVSIEYRTVIGITEMKTYDYMALGKPIVAFDIGDAREVIEGNAIGCVCPPDAVSLADLLKNMPSRDLMQMGRNARALAERTYNWDNTARDIDFALGAV
ncbi:MAG: glycosyltransferase [Candidatus Hydrogenedentota bacterium]